MEEKQCEKRNRMEGCAEGHNLTSASNSHPYRRRLLALAIPIVIQNLLSSCVNSADVLMLNFVGQDAISAVSLASQFSTILFMFYYGLGAGATMLCAQYYGKGNMDAIRVVEGIALRFSVLISAGMAAAVLLIPGTMMRIYTNDPVLIELGISYLRYVGPAYLCWGLIEVYLAVLRSMGRVRVAMAMNVMAFTLNIIFNAIFIFGLFGAPKMGAAGVALGTTLSRAIELAGCLVVSKSSSDIKLDLRYMFRRNGILFKDFIDMAIPATANDVIWGLAFSVYSVILGHLGSDAVAANSLVSVVRNFGTVMCFALASAGGIMLGQILGEGHLEEGREAAKELMLQTIVSACLGALIILAVMPFALHFASLSEVSMGYLKWMLLINVYYIFGPAINTTLMCGVFRSGGDSKYGVKVDLIDMWCYAVPLGLINAFVLKLPVMWVYFFMCTDEFVKWPWVFAHYRSGKWLKNITRDDWDREQQ